MPGTKLSTKLRVRAYDVRFGDAVLVTVPDRARNGRVVDRHILIDVGNVLTGVGGDDTVFAPVLEDVLTVTGGKPVDLYVLTHEHMDHAQGLLAGSRQGVRVRARHVWITASSAPGYYDRHPGAKKHFRFALRAYRSLERRLAAAPGSGGDRLVARMLNNNPRRTFDCVKHVRTQVCPRDAVHYVYRGSDLDGAHPFQEARFEIWAPEEDTSVYYGRFRPLALGAGAGPPAAPSAAPAPRPRPPAGVDPVAFEKLLDLRQSGAWDNLLAIDKARNNSSVVFALEWRGWRLLFPGDAEIRSWKTMYKQKGMIKPVHFLKVSHHGSHNGTPSGEILEALLPAEPADDRPRRVLVSTCNEPYDSVPHQPTLDELEARAELFDTRKLGGARFVDLHFEARARR